MEEQIITKNSLREANKKQPIIEFLRTIYWTIKINYQVMPGITIGRIVTGALINIDPLVSAFFYAKILDDFAKLLINKNSGTDIDFKSILFIALYFVIYKAISFLIANYNFYLDRIVEWNSRKGYSSLLARSLEKLNLADIEEPDFTDKLYRAKESLNDLSRQTGTIITIISVFIKAIASAISIYNFLGLEVLLIIVLSLPRFFTQGKMLREEWSFLNKITPERRKTTDNVEALFNNSFLPEIKLSGTFHFFLNRYMTFANWIAKEVEIQTRNRYILSYFYNILMYLVWGLGIYHLGVAFLNNEFSVGSLVFYLNVLLSYSDSVMYLINIVGSTYEFSLKFVDFREIIEKVSKLRDGRIVIKKLETSPEIEIKNVFFRYPNSEKDVLKNINIKINPGEKVAIVGHNGAGKTTFIRTLLRFFELQSGEILINGHNLTELKIASWYDQIGVLFQEYSNYYFLNVRDSIKIGNLQRKGNDDDVLQALKEADALDFVNEFPNKLDQELNEKYKGGIRPSTGQWQKLAIARFLYREPNVVIFDEPTASIDAVSESKIFNNIFNRFKNKTVIIISHRFSTVRRADRIVVIDKGEIVEQGSHAELLALNGVYAHSYNLQAEGYKE